MQIHRPGWLLAATCAAVAIASMASEAALPPSYYREMQDRAPEALEIVVLAVDDKQTRQSRIERGMSITTEHHALTITAIVERVTRSATGLRALSVIKIAYSVSDERAEDGRPLPPAVGGSSGPGRLAKGERRPAYLKFDQGTGVYVPAADHASFRELLPAQ
jgi:hypothetical protein